MRISQLKSPCCSASKEPWQGRFFVGKVGKIRTPPRKGILSHDSSIVGQLGSLFCISERRPQIGDILLMKFAPENSKIP
jgi:hypothetical protein